MESGWGVSAQAGDGHGVHVANAQRMSCSAALPTVGVLMVTHSCSCWSQALDLSHRCTPARGMSGCSSSRRARKTYGFPARRLTSARSSGPNQGGAPAAAFSAMRSGREVAGIATWQRGSLRIHLWVHPLSALLHVREVATYYAQDGPCEADPQG